MWKRILTLPLLRNQSQNPQNLQRIFKNYSTKDYPCTSTLFNFYSKKSISIFDQFEKQPPEDREPDPVNTPELCKNKLNLVKLRRQQFLTRFMVFYHYRSFYC